MAQRKIRLTSEQRALAETLFELYPGFLPTKSLYLDFEGSGSGHESVISLYWPQNSGSKRFEWIVRSEEEPLSSQLILDAVKRMGLATNDVNQVVAYSAGQEFPDERERLVDLLRQDPWPDATWVNLLWVTQQSEEMSNAIKQHRNVVFERDKKQVRRSLEALEWEFKILRKPSIRSHSNVYIDGADGGMEVLKLTEAVVLGQATPAETLLLKKYCLKDVKSMFDISRRCERGMFTSKERSNRYQSL